MPALALTDHGNLYGAIEFYKKAKEGGIKPILGVEAYLAPKSRFEKNSLHEKYFHITLIAKNNAGWQNLIALVTKGNLEGFYYKPRIDKELLAAHHEGLIVLSGCPSGEIARLLAKGNEEEARQALRFYKEIFGEDFFIEIWHQPRIPEINRLVPLLVNLAKSEGVPLVATQDIHYAKKEDSLFHDILLAVQTGNKTSDDNRLTMRAGDFSMRSPEEMRAAFAAFPEAIENTMRIAERCNVDIRLGGILLPHFPIPEGETSFSYLSSLINKRLPERFKEITPEIKDRLSYELASIQKIGFADYFLIVQDFVNWAKDRKIVVGPGRGSAAGSLVSYILKITDIDPLKYQLLFERFLNPDRIQMPDIDIDFTDVRRDEVIGYLKQKYGEANVAQIITFGTMASRASIRDVGRALGYSYSLCDQIAKLIPFNLGLEDALREVSEFKKMYDENMDVQKLVNAARRLEGVVRHASVHACGVVISKEPLTHYMPLQFAPQGENTIITQFEMYTVEDLGLLKMDLLGLKNLTIIEDAIRLIKEMEGVEVDISRIPQDDDRTFSLLRDGNTTGVFQLESSGIRRYLKELKPTDLEDIIAMVALYRPGPMELIPTYINRKFGKEKIVYLHPSLEPILSKTHGIGIYQEQMMRIARDLGGFTPSETDVLRKAIGKKIKKLLDQQKENLVSGMIKNGINAKTAREIWELFPPFARYGFNRSHAVCYATVSYQTAYLKTHFPVAFMASLLNAESNDIERIAFLVPECKRMGIFVLPPDINQSFTRFSPEGQHIRFGLSAVKNVGGQVVSTIISERQRGGPFKDFKNFISRVTHKDLNKKSLESLIKSGAFDSFQMDRNILLVNLDKITSLLQHLKKRNGSSQNHLFGDSPLNFHLAFSPAAPATKEEKLFWEKDLLGFYVSDHPLKKYEQTLKEKKVTPIKEVNNHTARFGLDGSVRIAGVIHNIKRIISKTKKPVAFVKIEDLTDSIEVIAFSEILERQPDAWQEKNIVIIQGKISRKDNDPKIICDQILRLQ